MDSQVQLHYQTDVNELDKSVRKFHRNEDSHLLSGLVQHSRPLVMGFPSVVQLSQLN